MISISDSKAIVNSDLPVLFLLFTSKMENILEPELWKLWTSYPCSVTWSFHHLIADCCWNRWTASGRIRKIKLACWQRGDPPESQNGGCSNVVAWIRIEISLKFIYIPFICPPLIFVLNSTRINYARPSTFRQTQVLYNYASLNNESSACALAHCSAAIIACETTYNILSVSSTPTEKRTWRKVHIKNKVASWK